MQQTNIDSRCAKETGSLIHDQVQHFISFVGAGQKIRNPVEGVGAFLLPFRLVQEPGFLQGQGGLVAKALRREISSSVKLRMRFSRTARVPTGRSSAINGNTPPEFGSKPWPSSLCRVPGAMDCPTSFPIKGFLVAIARPDALNPTWMDGISSAYYDTIR